MAGGLLADSAYCSVSGDFGRSSSKVLKYRSPPPGGRQCEKDTEMKSSNGETETYNKSYSKSAWRAACWRIMPVVVFPAISGGLSPKC